jgi:hypothetical protein
MTCHADCLQIFIDKNPSYLLHSCQLFEPKNQVSLSCWIDQIELQQYFKLARTSIDRANSKLMMFTVTLASFAAFNALCVPLHLEHQITLHPNTASIKAAGEECEAARS